MKYKPGLFSSLFRSSWRISIDRDALVCKKSRAHHRIEYFDIRGVRVETGLIWDTVTVTTGNQSLQLEGMSAKVAKSLRQDIETKTKDTIITHILGRQGALPEVEAQIKKILQSNQYISQNDIRNWVSQIPDIGPDLAHPYFDPDFLPKKAKSNLEVFLEIRKPDSPVLKQANEEFIQQASDEYSHLFHQLEEFPLSEEQIRAAVINEDRNLLIAAAGSGKSSTIVAKWYTAKPLDFTRI